MSRVSICEIECQKKKTDKWSETIGYMSKYASWNVMVGITRSKVIFLFLFFFLSFCLSFFYLYLCIPSLPFPLSLSLTTKMIFKLQLTPTSMYLWRRCWVPQATLKGGLQYRLGPSQLSLWIPLPFSLFLALCHFLWHFFLNIVMRWKVTQR